MSDGAGIEFEGGDALKKAIDKLIAQYPEAAAVAVYQEALGIGAESVKQVPVKTNRLRGSFYVQPPQDMQSPSAEIGYGTDYAVYVHERVELQHPVGKARFLLDPLNAARGGYMRRLGARILENAKKGVKFVVDSSTPSKPKG